MPRFALMSVFPQPDAAYGGAYRWYWRLRERQAADRMWRGEFAQETSEADFASKAEAKTAGQAAQAALQAAGDRAVEGVRQDIYQFIDDNLGHQED